MLPSIESLVRFHTFNRRIGSVCGFNFVVKLKITPLFVVVVVNAVIYTFINLNSVWQQRNDTNNMIYCLITAGFDAVGVTMMYESVQKNRIIIDLYEKALAFHTLRKEDSRVKQSLDTFCRSIRITQILSIQLLIAGLLLLTYPLAASIYYNKLVLVYGFYIPFLDPTTIIGFIVNMLYQALQTTIVVFGLTYVGNMYISFILQVVVQYDAMTDQLNELKVIGAQNLDHRFDEVITKKFKKIIQEYQGQLKYISDLETLINKILLVQILSTGQSILSTLYILIDEFWIAGFPILIFTTASLFVACIFGTIMENSAEAMMRAVYDTTWYQFSIKDQKSLLLLLTVSQQPHNLSFGGRAFLNMNTFMEFYKRIYSFYMMMRNIK